MVNRITIDESIFGSDTVFSDVSDPKIILDAGAFLISTFGISPAVSLDATAAPLDITINGTIRCMSNDNHLSIGGNNSAQSILRVGLEGEIGGPNSSNGKVLISTNTKVINAGNILGGGGDALQFQTAHNHSLYNSGLIEGVSFDDSGTHTIVNSGTIRNNAGNAISGFGADGVEKLTNTGLIDGNLGLGDGDDSVTDFAKVGGKPKHGTINGVVDLGAGDDTFKGGNNVEAVNDGAGSDTIKLGGGDDFYGGLSVTPGDGTDTVDGGAGIDAYIVSSSTLGVAINLDTKTHTGLFQLNDQVAKSTASGNDLFFGADKITGFENAVGGDGWDLIFGSRAVNSVAGGDGRDDLYGLDGDDRLTGGAGRDSLIGGKGKDTLIGGDDDDRFIFTSLSNSGITRATRDVITDFTQADDDKINLAAIDADTTTGEVQGFILLATNANFSGQAGELRSYSTASGTILDADVNGDGRPDFSVLLEGFYGTLTESDIIGLAP